MSNMQIGNDLSISKPALDMPYPKQRHWLKTMVWIRRVTLLLTDVQASPGSELVVEVFTN